MEGYLMKLFDKPPKNQSEEAMRRWRSAVGKNFDDLHKRSEVQAKQRKIQKADVEEISEEMKLILKIGYFSTGISIAGNISIFTGYLGDQSGRDYKVPLEVCSLLMTSTFVSGASILVLEMLHRSIRISAELFRNLKYTTFLFLTLSMFSVSIIFLKKWFLLAFAPTLFVVIISFLMARHPRSHRNIGRSMLPV